MVKKRRRDETPRFSLRDKLNKRNLEQEDDFSWDELEEKQEEDAALFDKFPLSSLIYMHKYMWEKLIGIIIFLILVYLLNFFNLPLAGNLKAAIYDTTVQDFQFEKIQTYPVFNRLKNLYPFGSSGDDGENSNEEVVSRPELIFPVEGAIAGKYGLRKDPFTGVTQMFYGIDLITASRAPVTAAASGQVIKIYEQPVYGLTVEIEHVSGISCIYAMLEEVLVEETDLVQQGKIIGYTAEEENPLLHFQIRKEGHPVDPQDYFSGTN